MTTDSRYATRSNAARGTVGVVWARTTDPVDRGGDYACRDRFANGQELHRGIVVTVEEFEFAGVEPDALAFGAVVDLDALVFERDEDIFLAGWTIHGTGLPPCDTRLASMIALSFRSGGIGLAFLQLYLVRAGLRHGA